MAKNFMDNLDLIAQNTQNDSIQMIDIDELHPSEDNFFEVKNIPELASAILGQGGVKDNLIVTPLQSGGYEIVSGHRRTAAVRYLLDTGETISRFLPCLVQHYNSHAEKMIDLILGNVTTRQISDRELWHSYEELDKQLKERKEAGEKFGRIRETIANQLGISPAQVGKMQNIERNAIEEIKEAVENGDLSISTASEIAKMDEEEQEELAKGGKLDEVKHKDVKKKNTESKAAKKKTVPEPQKDEVEDFDEVIGSDEEVDTYINSESEETENADYTESDAWDDEEAARSAALKIIIGIGSMEDGIMAARCNLSKAEYLAGLKCLEDISKYW